MCKVFSSCFIFLICIFSFNCTLKGQTRPPCDFMFHGRDVYQGRYPEASNFPLSRMTLPIEFSLNNSIPLKYRSVVREAALKWNETVGLELITISDEIDHSTWSTQQQNPRFNNVIYWLTEDQYGAENMTLRNGISILGGKTVIAAASPFHPSIRYVFILNSDIVIYEQSNDPIKLTRPLCSLHF